jgi:hypothetical protein
VEVAQGSQRRIFAILLVLAVLAGGYFLGGDGVRINSLFGAYLAMSILAGLFFSRLEDRPHPWAASAPGFLFPGWSFRHSTTVAPNRSTGTRRSLSNGSLLHKRASIPRSHFCASSPDQRSAKACCAVISPASLRLRSLQRHAHGRLRQTRCQRPRRSSPPPSVWRHSSRRPTRR